MFAFSPGTLGSFGPNRGPKPDFTDTGLTLFLVSLGVVFASGLVGYWKVRSGQPDWIDPWDTKGLTYVLVASFALSLTDALHVAASRREWSRDARKWLGWALVAIGVYLVAQLLQWLELSARIRASKRVEIASVGILLALHALHALGGFCSTAWVWWKLRKREPTMRTKAEPLARLCRYWRFLTWTWGILLLALLWP